MSKPVKATKAQHSPQKASLASHYIEGYAQAALDEGFHGKDAYFDTSLWSHIEGNLWMGGCISHVELPEGFKHVLSLYPWEKYKLGDGCVRTEFAMHDVGKMPRTEDLARAVSIGVSMVRDGQTLIHCQAGLNRSGLVSALVLRKLNPGMPSKEAIDLLRRRRDPLVLCNRTFVNYLLALDD